MQATSPARLLIIKDKMAMQETPPRQQLIIAGSPLIIDDRTATILTAKRSPIQSAGTFETFDASTIKSTNSFRKPWPANQYSDLNSIESTAGASYLTTGASYSTKGGDESWLCPADNAFDVAASAGVVMGLLPAPSTLSMYDDDTQGGDTWMARSPAFGCSALDVECVEGKYLVLGDFESAVVRSRLAGESLLDGESVMGGSAVFVKKGVLKGKGVEVPMSEKGVSNGDVGEGVEVFMPEWGVLNGEGDEAPLLDIDVKDSSEDNTTVATAKTGMKKKTIGNALKKSARSFFGGEAKKRVRKAERPRIEGINMAGEIRSDPKQSPPMKPRRNPEENARPCPR
jgi:hypothetical protein